MPTSKSVASVTTGEPDTFLSVIASLYAGWSPSPTFVGEEKASPRLLENLAADQHAADFAGAGADLVELCVAQQPPGRIVVDVAVAAEALDGFERHPGRAFGGVKDGAGGVLARGLAAIAGFGDGIDVGLRRIQRHIHVGELGLHHLEAADRLPD